MPTMQPTQWRGVFPAVTTPFTATGDVDHAFLASHCERFIATGSRGIVALGSLGEGATLSFDEKVAILDTLVRAAAGRIPVVAGIASLSTGEAVALAQAAERVGCGGLMVLPPYVYKSDWYEMRAHVSAVMQATGLSCMLYNNPAAYGTDFLPHQIAELAAGHATMHAVKDSSGDVRRITAIRALVGDRLALFVGLDDAIVEGVAAGADGWVAGLINALPAESVQLWDAAVAGDRATARRMYEWFLPLLRLDTVPKFVQLIKLVQQEVDLGHERVRAPRLLLVGTEREEALAITRQALATRAAIFG